METQGKSRELASSGFVDFRYWTTVLEGVCELSSRPFLTGFGRLKRQIYCHISPNNRKTRPAGAAIRG